MTQSRCRFRRGFTLFELMLVVFLIAIMGMIVVPQTGQFGATRLSTAASMLAADVDFCGSECINNPSALRQMQFNPAGNCYWVAATTAPNTPIAHPGDGQPFRNDFLTGRCQTLSGIQLVSTTNLPNTGILQFDAFGKPSNVASDVVITLGNGTQTMSVTVSAATGEVSIH